MRDGYRCMLTGLTISIRSFSTLSWKIVSLLMIQVPLRNVPISFPRLRRTASRRCDCVLACVVPVLMSFFKSEYAASAMTILEIFGLNNKAENLVGSNVHKYFNILTMRSDLHVLFDRLQFWLEEVMGEASKLMHF
jgi:hypothetical protein